MTRTVQFWLLYEGFTGPMCKKTSIGEYLDYLRWFAQEVAPRVKS